MLFALLAYVIGTNPTNPSLTVGRSAVDYPCLMSVARAQTAYRRTRVVELVADGANYDKAAREVGYANRSGAFKAFWKALGEREAEAVDTHRALELTRLDALQRAVWEQAESGDVRALEAVLKIMDRRAKLLGLDQVESEGSGSRPLVDPAFWAMVRETYGGKLEAYLGAAGEPRSS
jgi:hypothetical protein